ncbi:kelch domain-containing protein 1-like [Watersipora subatra]|uniref:kelch domain-containing protein 1-like n=1 Tax=Watersipora subatra TaxID=2589382 RepID=UPI00355C6AE0
MPMATSEEPFTCKDYHSIVWKVGDSKTEVKPTAREGHCSCVIRDALYVFGGVSIDSDEQAHENADLWRFDLTEGKWTEVACASASEKPMSRSAATMVAVNNKLYLFGGLNHSIGWLDNLFVFDIETSCWFEEDEYTGDMPSPREKLSSAVIGNKVWLFGGFGPQLPQRGPLDLEDDEDLSSDDEIGRLERQQEAVQLGWFDQLHEYDTEAKVWAQPMQLSMGKPSPRCATSMVAHNSTLVIFGGRDAEGRLNDLHFFNTETRKWNKERDIKGAVPACRSFHSAALCGSGAMAVTGGRSVDDQHFADVYLFNLDSSSWKQIDSVGLSARGCHTMNSIGEKLVVFGGSSSYSASQQHCDVFHNDLLIAELHQAENGTSDGTPTKIRKVA